MRSISIRSLLGIAASMGVGTLGVFGGSAMWDFKSDPTQGTNPLILLGSDTNPGGNGGAWEQAGGIDGDNDGYLVITGPTGSQWAKIIFPDIDQGKVIAAFTFECQLRVGNGSNPPADGFSINYARADDPTFNKDGNGNYQNGGWSGTTAEPGSVGGSMAGLPEEGTITGLAIGFDAWNSNSALWPADLNPGINDVIGISVRVDNKVVTQVAMPVNDGACNDLGSLQTGPRDPGGNAADVSGLCWQTFKVQLTDDGFLSIWWKTDSTTGQLNPILDKVKVNFNPSAGRLVFGGRTGGSFQNQHIDNIKLDTIGAEKVIIGSPTGNPVGFRITTADSGPAVADMNTVQMKFDGVDVTPIEKSKNGGTATFGWWDVTKPLVVGSTHKVWLKITDGRGITVEAEREYTVPDYVAIPAGYAVAGVDTSKPGFNVRAHYRPITDPQTTEPLAGYEMENTIARAEAQVYGLRGANLLTTPSTTEEGVINYSFDVNADGTTTQYGAFQASADADGDGTPDNLDAHYPDTTPWGIDPNLDTSNIAAVIDTYVYFPEAGVYTVVFNSDDGFRTTSFANVNDVLNATIVSQADVGRGATDTATTIYIPAEGYYPMRTAYMQGGGGANLEWSGYQTVPAITTRRLLNDGTKADALKCYRTRTTPAPAAVTFLSPMRDSGNPYLGTMNLAMEIQDGAAPVSDIKVQLDGQDITMTPQKVGDRTKLTYDPPGLLMPNKTYTVAVVFKSGAENYAGSYTFNTFNIVPVPPSLALPAAAVDKNKPGFLVRTVQQDSGESMANDIYRANIQLEGLTGWANTVDPALFTGPGGYYVEEAVINYVSTGENGWFDGTAEYNRSNWPDTAVPGIPGIDPVPPAGGGSDMADGGTDNYSQEILTVLDLQPGVYVMGVNSDDGFRMCIGNPEEWRTFPVEVGNFNGGRGAGGGAGDGTTFAFEIKQAGLYPVRVIWWEGGGGSSIEWSSIPHQDGVIKYQQRVLINDFNVTGYVPAYQYPITSAGAPWVKRISPARAGRGSAASPNRAGTDATVMAVLDQGAGTIATASVKMTLDGAEVPATVNQVGSEVRVSYQPAAGFSPGSSHTAVVTYGDRSVSWTFNVGNTKAPVFVIEAEDFDSNRGQSKPEASVMPYEGGAYAGLSAVNNVDYTRGNEGSSPLYRMGEDPQVPMDRTGERDRGSMEVVVNYKLGWIGGGQFYNYTRDLPSGRYNVYAAISHGESNPNQLNATLKKVTGGAASDLGTFVAPGTGGWGNNALVPLKDTAGNVLALDLAGTTTLQYAPSNGDWDFMMLVPAADDAQPVFTAIKKNADGTVTVEWTGGGALQAAPSVVGPWQTVDGAASPYTFTPSALMLYGRIQK